MHEPVDQADVGSRGGRRAAFAAAMALALGTFALPQPSFAQFGLSLGGLSLGGGRGGYGGRGEGMRVPGPGYGGMQGGMRPQRPGYPSGMGRPGGMGGYPTGMGRPGGMGGYPTGMVRPRPQPGYPPGTGRPYPVRPPVMGQPYPRPPWGMRPGYPVRPPPYRPPVMVDDEPRARPRRPVMIAQPPVRQLRPLRLQQPAYAAPAVPAARPPTARPVPPPPVVAAAPDRTHVDREVLVEVSGGQPANAIDRIAGQRGLTRLGVTELTLAGTTVYRLRVNGRRSVDAAVDDLSRDGRVALAQRNHVYRLQVDQGQAYYPLAASQYAATKLRLVDAHRYATGEGVTVAVIDSGVDASHPELQGAIGASENTLSTEAKPDQHGTAIAGAIGARGQLMGVAPKTRIIAIRAFAPAIARARAEGTSWDIVRAVDLAAKSGAKVVNMSFAGPADRLMSRELAGGLRRGIVYVAAAGNGGAAAAPAYPAAEPGVIAVTATDVGDKLYASANQGPYVTIAAPGVDILVASPSGAYDTTSGTSVAAAHVSGIVALMLQRDGSLSPMAIRATLAARARDLGVPGPDPEYGAGLIDAHAALGLQDVPVAAAPVPAPRGNPPPPPPIPVASAEPAPTVPTSTPPVAPAPTTNPTVASEPPPPPAQMAERPQVFGSPPPPPPVATEPTPAGSPPPPPPEPEGAPTQGEKP